MAGSEFDKLVASLSHGIDFFSESIDPLGSAELIKSQCDEMCHVANRDKGDPLRNAQKLQNLVELFPGLSNGQAKEVQRELQRGANALKRCIDSRLNQEQRSMDIQLDGWEDTTGEALASLEDKGQFSQLKHRAFMLRKRAEAARSLSVRPPDLDDFDVRIARLEESGYA